MSDMEQMNISITSQLASFVRGRVKSGRYNNASEVVREALRLMEERELAQLRAAIQEGINAVERGEYTDYDDGSVGGLIEEVKATGRQLLKARRKAAAEK